jgi:hypothetical protein
VRDGLRIINLRELDKIKRIFMWARLDKEYHVSLFRYVSFLTIH